MIVTCGEALVDLVPEHVNGETLYRPVLGGSHYNVALGIARLGGTSGYLWEISTDDLGAMLLHSLAEAGVETAAVARGVRATPVAVVDLSGPEARYNIADPDGVMLDTPLAGVPAGTACLLVGSATLAREPIASTIEGVAAAAPLLALDYNCRPPSIVDRAAYRARLERMSRRAGIVKASVADLALLGIADPHAYMEELIAAGAGLSVLTAAEEGAIGWTRHARVVSPSAAVRLVDTVGAGDAFMAGLLVALQREGLLARSRLEELGEGALTGVLAFAQQAAAFTCSCRGAVMPTAANLAQTAVNA